jgi:Rrf2 family transcriptional regulator, iron-sulfur cluster assembly transcription factor
MHIGTAVRLSNKGRYAVRALFDIAYFNQGQATQAKDIAERQSIPPRFLEQIFQDLKRAGIVASKRGPQGGYSLAVTEAVFRDLSERVESCFDGVTLADICARAQTMGVPRGPKESYSYVI